MSPAEQFISSFNIVFDLDGTLVDSKDALIAAYEFAGVKNPEPLLATAWPKWCTLEQHSIKNDVYPSMLKRYGKLLPLAKFASKGNWPVITFASRRGVDAVREVFDLELNVFRYGCGVSTKAECLKQLHHRGVPRMYVDDNAVQLKEIVAGTGWFGLSPQQAERLFL